MSEAHPRRLKPTLGISRIGRSALPQKELPSAISVLVGLHFQNGKDKNEMMLMLTKVGKSKLIQYIHLLTYWLTYRVVTYSMKMQDQRMPGL